MTDGPGSATAVIRTPDQRLRVFVSSTLEELAAERAAARKAIEQLRLNPVMFELGARPHPPRDLYRAYLEQSHVFLGIYWQRYGWIAPGEETSGLENEYLLAGQRPKLIYVKRAATRDPRLVELLDRVVTEASASYRTFEDAVELQDLVQNDLATLLTERFELVDTPRAVRRSWGATTNLPMARNPLVGRDRELAEACALLTDDTVCLVTLYGPGGSGKSRLALQVALELVDRFESGVYFVPLESIRDPALVMPAIGEALGVRGALGVGSVDAVAELVADKRLLILLDNFEQVVDAGPGVAALLERCPRLAVLVTSRVPLRLRQEHQVAVRPLPVPALRELDPDELMQNAAVALFTQRARAVSPGFTVSPENAAVVAEICRRLDGLPLAIELAAPRLRMFSPDALLERLGQRFALLRGGTRDLPTRHQTLRGTIAWSHDLLDENARRVFRRLSVFAGGSTLEAAEALTDLGDLTDDAVEILATLVDHNMIVATISESGELRIGMLDSIRDYAAEQLDASGDRARIAELHARQFVTLGIDAKPHLTSLDEPQWAARLRTERDNIRSALQWSVTNDVQAGLELAASISRFWEAHNGVSEGHYWLERLLSIEAAPTGARARALRSAAMFSVYVGDYVRARVHLQTALPIAEALGDRRQMATILNELGLLASFDSDYPNARLLLEQSLAIKRELGEDWMTANTLTNLGLVAGYEGDHVRGYEHHLEAHTLFGAIGDREGIAIATGNLGYSAMRLGRFDEARTHQLESFRLFQLNGDSDGSAECMDRLAMLANALGDHRTAAQLFGLAEVLREESGTTPMPHEREELSREVASTRASLGPERFEIERDIGRSLDIRALDLSLLLG